MAALAGFLGRIIVNGTNLHAYHWTIDAKVDDFDVTTFENFGVGQYEAGIADFDISFDAYYDPVDNPFNGPLNLTPGFFAAITIRYNKAGATQSWTFPNVLITSVHNETGVRDVIRYTVTGKASVLASNQVPSEPLV